MTMMSSIDLQIHALTNDRWNDLAALFAASPVTGSCWCMWPRVSVGEMHARTAEQNQQEFQATVEAGRVPGLLAYADGEPVGWCSAGPRHDYGRFFSESDTEPVWLIACLFLRDSHRGRRIGSALLEAAVAYAGEQGAVAVEGPPRGWRPDDDPASLEGVIRMFRKAGFRDVADPQAPAMMRKDGLEL